MKSPRLQVEAIRELVHQGADKEARDVDGMTPLHFAVGEGQVEAMQVRLCASFR